MLQLARRTVPVGLIFLSACGGGESAHSAESAILGGEAATTIEGVAFVRRTEGGTVCSGALIAPDLLVTAKHCVFEAGPAGDRPAEVAGIRVGFGMNEGSLI